MFKINDKVQIDIDGPIATIVNLAFGISAIVEYKIGKKTVSTAIAMHRISKVK